TSRASPRDALRHGDASHRFSLFTQKGCFMAKVNGVVRVGLIGWGGISHAHGLGFNKYSDKIKCVALCDVSADNLKKRSDQLGGVSKQFNDWKVMLKEMGNEIDAVDICLPHNLHGP